MECLPLQLGLPHLPCALRAGMRKDDPPYIKRLQFITGTASSKTTLYRLHLPLSSLINAMARNNNDEMMNNELVAHLMAEEEKAKYMEGEILNDVEIARQVVAAEEEVGSSNVGTEAVEMEDGEEEATQEDTN